MHSLYFNTYFFYDINFGLQLKHNVTVHAVRHTGRQGDKQTDRQVDKYTGEQTECMKPFKNNSNFACYKYLPKNNE